MKQLKINLDPVMQIILILKSMAFEIIEVVGDSLQEKQHVELQQALLQKLY